MTNGRLRITDVVRVPLRELGVAGKIEPAWSPGLGVRIDPEAVA